MATRHTGKASIERQIRVSAILTKRLSGMSLQAIAQEQTPPCSPQNIHAVVQRVLRSQVNETVEQARSLELMRLDELLGAIWKTALSGDIACIDRCVMIMHRRARLLGLDLQPSLRAGDGPVDEHGVPVVRVEIVNDPEIKRVQWLEERSERLRELEVSGALIPADRVVN